MYYTLKTYTCICVGTHINEGLSFILSLQYIGCLEVKESMRQLDFDTRTALARYNLLAKK